MVVDYSNIVTINLLNQHINNEETLTQGFKKLIDDTSSKLDKKTSYEYFDFQANCKKGSLVALDNFLQDIIRPVYLREIGFYKESVTFNDSVSELTYF